MGISLEATMSIAIFSFVHYVWCRLLSDFEFNKNGMYQKVLYNYVYSVYL